jgi:chromosome segregation ATPase
VFDQPKGNQARTDDLIDQNKSLAMQLDTALKNTASLKAKFSKQASDVTKLLIHNCKLATDVEELKKVAADLQATDTRHRQTAQQLQTKNDQLKKEIASSKNDNAFLEAKIKERTDHIFSIREDIVTLQQCEQTTNATIKSL